MKRLAGRLLVTVAVLLTMAIGAAGQSDPKAYLATKTVDYSVARSLPYHTPDQVMFENVIVNGQHFALLMNWKKAKLEPAELRPLATAQIAEVANGAITIDGSDSDWSGILPVLTDPVGPRNPQYVGVDGTDIANVRMAHDDEFLYVRMALHNGGPIIETQYAVEFQQYLYQLHTPGDRTIWCIKWQNSPDWSLLVTDRTGNVVIAEHSPGTGSWVATGDGWLEWKVPLAEVLYPSNTPLPYYPAAPADKGIENRYVRVYINPTGLGYGVSDENDPMTRPLIINFYE